MKLSIAASLLILAAAAGFGWHNHQRLTTARETREKLVAEAATLGISPDPKHPTEHVLITKRAERENTQAEAKAAAVKFIAFAKEMEELEKKGERPDEDTQKRIMEFMDLMMSLDASQLKTLIADLRAAPDLKDETRQGLVGWTIMTLANDHPQAALAIFTESADLFKDGRMGDQVISSALSRWAKDDPMGALEWVRKNSEKFPDLVTDDAKRGLLSGAAAQDPKLALQLTSELKLEDSSEVIRAITRSARTPEERTAALSALREHFASFQDSNESERLIKNAVSSLVREAAEDGFDSATQWIADATLSPEELEYAADNSLYSVKTSETGQWIDWLGKTLPDGKADEPINDMVRRWTQQDYQAAGTWLASAPDGPTKNIAVRSYAETVAKYDPETAAQWALTLPAGDARKETLKSIYQQWPRDDEASRAASEAFGKEHGFTK